MDHLHRFPYYVFIYHFLKKYKMQIFTAVVVLLSSLLLGMLKNLSSCRLQFLSPFCPARLRHSSDTVLLLSWCPLGANSWVEPQSDRVYVRLVVFPFLADVLFSRGFQNTLLAYFLLFSPVASQSPFLAHHPFCQPFCVGMAWCSISRPFTFYSVLFLLWSHVASCL